MQEIDLSKSVSRNEAGVLAGLWRKIVRENNFENNLGFFINKYINKHHSQDGTKKVLKTKSKSTLLTNISATEMSIKVFLDLLFNLLNVKYITISIKLTFPNGEESIHSIKVENDTSGDANGGITTEYTNKPENNSSDVD